MLEGPLGDVDIDMNLVVRMYYAPVLLGTIMATFLFGVNCNQFVCYLSCRRNDSWLTQGMVGMLLVVCALQECLAIYTLWFLSVQNFGNYSALVIPFWATTISLGVLMAIISVSVQQYFIWRVKAITQSWLLFGVLSLCSVVAGALCFLNACTGVVPSKDPFSVDVAIDLAYATLAANVFVNVANAGLLLYYLLKYRTGFQRTQSVIRRLAITCVESPLLITAISLADMITFKTTFPQNWYLIVAMPLGQVYMLSIIALLNARASLRAAWNGVTDMDANELERSNRLIRQFTLNTQEPVRVGVTVEQHAHVEVDPFAGRIKGERKRGKAGFANTGSTSVGSDIKAQDEHEMAEFSLTMRALNDAADVEDDERKIAVVA